MCKLVALIDCEEMSVVCVAQGWDYNDHKCPSCSDHKPTPLLQATEWPLTTRLKTTYLVRVSSEYTFPQSSIDMTLILHGNGVSHFRQRITSETC